MDRKVITAVADKIIAMDIRYHLEEYGYNVVDSASSIEELRDSIKRLLPDLLIIDVTLADRTERTDILKGVSNLSYASLILISSMDTKNTNKLVYDIPGSEYILKPFNVTDLVKTADRMMKNRNLQEFVNNSV